ncbi:uncharacterized protein LOC120251280 [Dioscorea cayenensis subsp. rotundata]|uniref:Uncharacterized protein LOC120251280 n=1 Tax=Dioscorea cayennensis subsp. rotundata TaxID=55577 RepID=A0AB40AL95_DIOCR|nr:uncharacterized protein LOC120251280 [Dioscorea cayenensis subsp. rotundata]
MANPKESLMGVTLSSGMQLQNSIKKELELEVANPIMTTDMDVTTKDKTSILVYQQKPSFPAKARKDQQELLTHKRKLGNVFSLTPSEECSILLCNKLSKKEKDPGGFILPCTIGGLVDEKALADLGVNIDDKVEVPIILGRPFIATSNALIDVKDGRITLQGGDEETTFRLRDSMRHTIDFDNTCYCVDVVDEKMPRKDIAGGPSKRPRTDASSSGVEYQPTFHTRPHIE